MAPAGRTVKGYEVKPHHHGTLTGYTYGCRCQPCRTCNSLAVRARKRQGIPEADPRHGSLAGYSAGCRCEPCTDSKSASNGSYRLAHGRVPTGSVSRDEVRAFGMGLGLPIASRGFLPAGLIQRWNREHPDRPYEAER